MPIFSFRIKPQVVEIDAESKGEAIEKLPRYVLDHFRTLALGTTYIRKRPRNTTEFIDKTIRPLAKKLQKEFPGYKARVMGPFGLDVEVLIVLDNGNEDQSRSLTFTPGRDFALMLKDYSKNLQRFKPGTLGEINGMNYGTIPVPKKNRVSWLKERLITHLEAP